MCKFILDFRPVSVSVFQVYLLEKVKNSLVGRNISEFWRSERRKKRSNLWWQHVTSTAVLVFCHSNHLVSSKEKALWWILRWRFGLIQSAVTSRGWEEGDRRERESRRAARMIQCFQREGQLNSTKKNMESSVMGIDCLQWRKSFFFFCFCWHLNVGRYGGYGRSFPDKCQEFQESHCWKKIPGNSQGLTIRHWMA